jgi:hypothetical protein
MKQTISKIKWQAFALVTMYKLRLSVAEMTASQAIAACTF